MTTQQIDRTLPPEGPLDEPPAVGRNFRNTCLVGATITFLVVLTNGPTAIAALSSVALDAEDVPVAAVWAMATAATWVTVLASSERRRLPLSLDAPATMAFALLFSLWYVVSAMWSGLWVGVFGLVYLVAPTLVGLVAYRTVSGVGLNRIEYILPASQAWAALPLIPPALGVGLVTQFSRQVVPGLSVHATGRSAALIFVGASIAFVRARSVRGRAAALMAATAAAFVALRIESRMAMLASVISISVLIGTTFLASMRSSLAHRSAGNAVQVGMAAITSSAVILAILLATRLTGRFAQFAPETGDVSVSTRASLAGSAWDTFVSLPPLEKALGVGAGVYTTSPETIYPHNILLEMGVEVGLVGLLMFALAIVAPWRHILRSRAVRTTYALFLVQLAYSLGSGSYQRTWELWLWLGILGGAVTMSRQSQTGVVSAARAAGRGR